MKEKRTYLVSPVGMVDPLRDLYGEPLLTGGGEFLNHQQRFPQVRNPENTRVLYIADHPLNMLLSFEKRITGEKWYGLIRSIQGDENGMRNISGRDGATLERYADQGANLFDFHQHLAGWRWYCQTNNIEFLFVKYENLQARQMEINYFLRRDTAPIEFPTQSNFLTDPRDELIAKLTQIHYDDIMYYNEYKHLTRA